ncbi:RRQRL motif-containing zinc-binding protein [Streptomyces sp. NPDC057743]|uniref:RRQRL motif-containing zinc-binding protein n=1 Tax=Streptomyces sp. NPDC057743 TaxID=3346236 RepID=UPI0036804AE6
MGRLADLWDPKGERHDVPTFLWRMAPDGLATRDQLVAKGLRPRGPAVAQVMWFSKKSPGVPRFARLYPVDRATPPKPRSPGQIASLAAAMRARRTCPECGEVREYCIATSLKACTPCADGFTAAA